MFYAATGAVLRAKGTMLFASIVLSLDLREWTPSRPASR
ncbi:hypothetical protein NIES2104_50260 [Leptolyngbya sp. NIES-2104]|nr:hypothetical protein NIES2104_50260 [Leptolyngbya sp. NIES-2104]